MATLLMHVNYFERAGSFENLFDRAVFHGFDGLELRVTPEGMTHEEYAQLVKEQCDRTGCKHIVFGIPCNVATPDGAERRAAIDNAIAFLKATSAISCGIYNTYAGTLLAEGATYREFHRNGSACATENNWKWTIEAYQELGDVAESLGVRLAFETHNCYIHDLAKPTRELLDRIDRPAVGANIDMGNIVLNANGESVADAIDILKERIYYVHLKNAFLVSTGGYVICDMDAGVIDHRDYLRRLKAIGYAGPICLEAPRQGDRDRFARHDLAYIREICQEIGL